MDSIITKFKRKINMHNITYSSINVILDYFKV